MEDLKEYSKNLLTCFMVVTTVITVISGLGAFINLDITLMNPTNWHIDFRIGTSAIYVIAWIVQTIAWLELN